MKQGSYPFCPFPSICSLVSVACLDYFFTQPLFAFYMTDSHEWVVFTTFEDVALLVSRLSNHVVRDVRKAEVHRSQLQRDTRYSFHFAVHIHP